MITFFYTLSCFIIFLFGIGLMYTGIYTKTTEPARMTFGGILMVYMAIQLMVSMSRENK